MLVVDDEPALLRATGRLLELAGFVVTTRGSGPEAARRLVAERFDVVLSDLDMRDLGGIALLKMLRERDMDIPVVLVTGAPTLDSAMPAVEYGAFRYLTKPVARDELVAPSSAPRARAVDAPVRGNEGRSTTARRKGAQRSPRAASSCTGTDCAGSSARVVWARSGRPPICSRTGSLDRNTSLPSRACGSIIVSAKCFAEARSSRLGRCAHVIEPRCACPRESHA